MWTTFLFQTYEFSRGCGLSTFWTCWLKLWTTHLLSKFWFSYFFSHVHFKRRNSYVHGISFYCPKAYAIRKLTYLWAHCTFTRKPNISNICKHFKKTTNQPTKEVWQHILKISKFHQPSTSHHLISSTLLLKWPDSLAPYY
jgi:hypothetical protein